MIYLVSVEPTIIATNLEAGSGSRGLIKGEIKWEIQDLTMMPIAVIHPHTI